jgi:ubiquinol-cytochrome c reductase cytochrome b subunit
VKSIRYRGPLWKIAFAGFVVSFLILGYLGVEPTTVWGAFPEGMPLIAGDYVATWVARLLTIVYFYFFLAMPWYTARDKERPEPQRVTWR